MPPTVPCEWIDGLDNEALGDLDPDRGLLGPDLVAIQSGVVGN